jgi:hypothetical protein
MWQGFPEIATARLAVHNGKSYRNCSNEELLKEEPMVAKNLKKALVLPFLLIVAFLISELGIPGEVKQVIGLLMIVVLMVLYPVLLSLATSSGAKQSLEGKENDPRKSYKNQK